MDTLLSIFKWINGYLWGVPMIVTLIFTHLFLTYKTKFIQRKLGLGIRLSVSSDGDSGSINHFEALTTALASTIGTGNIIGVATAITLGGPGAVFWTWITGFFGIATKYVESFIAIKYRRKMPNGEILGGAMITLDTLGYKFLAIAFAIITSFCAFGIGCSVQANAITSVVVENFKLSPWVIGAILSLLTFVVTFGGVKQIAKVCEKLVPLMSLVYILGCLYILFYNHAVLLDTIFLIVSSAFKAQAITGGFIGSTLMIAARYGIARGLFSNESGLGSSPIISACAVSKNACKQALIASTGTFWDTVVVCLLTGLVLVSTILKNPTITSVNVEGAKLASMAFSQIPYIGKPLLMFGIITFSFSTILGWSYYGEACLKYLFGNKVIKAYRIAWILVVYLGCVMSLTLVFEIADTLNALMAIPNLIAIYLCINIMVKDTNYYIYSNKIEDEDSSLIQ